MKEAKKNALYYLTVTAIGLLDDMVYQDKKQNPNTRVNKSIIVAALIRQEAERRQAK